MPLVRTGYLVVLAIDWQKLTVIAIVHLQTES